MLHHSDVEKHNNAESLWVIVNGNAYDLTEVSDPDRGCFSPSSPLPSTARPGAFLSRDTTHTSILQFAPEHPGGSKILLKYAGKDATEVRRFLLLSPCPRLSRWSM